MTDTAFEEAVERYADMVFRLAYSYLRNRADAEDVMQETLLKLYRESAFDTLEHERYWVVRVAVNECKRIACRPWRSRTVPLESCAEPAFEDRARRELYQSVMELPAKYRVPLYLYYYEGLSVAETAAAMRANVSTVQTWLLRARARLRKELTEEKEESVHVRPQIVP